MNFFVKKLQPFRLFPIRFAPSQQRFFCSPAKITGNSNQESSSQDSTSISSRPHTFDLNKYYSEHTSLSVRTLFEAGVHLGHKTNLWNPAMKPYLYGAREGVHIIDLESTILQLKNTLRLLTNIAMDDGVILFLSLKPAFESLVEKTATDCGEYYVSKKWISGTLTNRRVTHRTKNAPDCLIVLSVPYCSSAIQEANSLSIPTVGIIDSDCNPGHVSYPVCGNDDSLSAMQLYCNLFSSA
eukprot:Sdes_comp17474_c0_seq1m6712